MIDPSLLLAFVPAALALNVTPGADMLFCIGQGMRGDPASAWAASAGISTGSMVHSCCAGAGLAALLAAAPWAFEAIRWVGVAYLLGLAYRSLSFRPPQARGNTGRRAYFSGLIVNLTNPKVALFILAFVPQFIDPSRPVFAQFLIFGAILSVGGFFINGCAGVFAGSVGQGLASRGRALGYLTSGIFAALALRLAFLERA